MIIEEVNESPVLLYLEHHGVKGQRWGIRRKSKQLSPEKAAKYAKKAEKYTARADIAQKKITELQSKRKTLQGSYSIGRNNKKIKDLQVERSRALDDAKRKSQGKLSKAQKRHVIEVSAAAALIAAYSGYKLADSGKFRQLATEGKAWVRGDTEFTNVFHKNTDLAKDMNVDEIAQKVMPQINKGYGDIGTKVNCRRCTYAYEMRRRGYDVSATKTVTGIGQVPVGFHNITEVKPSGRQLPLGTGGTFKEVFRNYGKPKETEAFTLASKMNARNSILPTFGQGKRGEVSAERVFASLAQNPNKARGELGFSWHLGGGHSVAWEVIDNKPVIFDNQSGIIMRNADEFRKAYHDMTIGNAGFTRLDDIPLNPKFLARWVKNAA